MEILANPFLADPLKEIKDTPTSVYRLISTCYRDKRGNIYFTKKLQPLKRKCKGFQILDDEIDMVGADCLMSKITNLYQCNDGIYKLILVNKCIDYESGCLEDWDYILSKYEI